MERLNTIACTNLHELGTSEGDTPSWSTINKIDYFTIDSNNLPITEGKVHFIREVKEDGTISVLNEDFGVNKSLTYEYAWAILHTKQEQLMKR